MTVDDEARQGIVPPQEEENMLPIQEMLGPRGAVFLDRKIAIKFSRRWIRDNSSTDWIKVIAADGIEIKVINTNAIALHSPIYTNQLDGYHNKKYKLPKSRYSFLPSVVVGDYRVDMQWSNDPVKTLELTIYPPPSNLLKAEGVSSTLIGEQIASYSRANPSSESS